MYGSQGVLGNDLLSGIVFSMLLECRITFFYPQVEDVDKKFAKLERVEKNNWVDVEDEAISKEKCIRTRKNSVGVAKKRAAVVKKVASAGLKALIAAKRRKASASVGGGDIDNKHCEDNKENSNDVDSINIIIDKSSEDGCCLISPEKTFDGGFFSVKSPVRQVMKSPRTSRSTGKKGLYTLYFRSPLPSG